MKLTQIYRCFCDETRLRILHLLGEGPLCVCHFQDILRLPQVTVSKHLASLRANGFVTAKRHGKWMIYRLPQASPAEVRLQLRCLRDCARSDPVFRGDLKRRSGMACDCDWVEQAAREESDFRSNRPVNHRRAPR